MKEVIYESRNDAYVNFLKDNTVFSVIDVIREGFSTGFNEGIKWSLEQIIDVLDQPKEDIKEYIDDILKSIS